MLRFVEFVKKNIGSTHLEIADYFARDIEDLASECEINWRASMPKISWNGLKNKKPKVVGNTDEDSRRSFIWAEECTYKEKGDNPDSFTYPYVSFKNMRQTINQPGRKFHALRKLFDAYEEYKQSNKTPEKRPKRSEAEYLEMQKNAAAEDEALEKRKQAVIDAEPDLFADMRHLSHPKAFSPYLEREKKLHLVAEQFDIRVGRDKDGYFTCFPLHTIHGELKALQRIYHVLPQGWDDNKRSTWGVDTTGLMFIIGELNEDTEMIYICEGLATGLAMFAATGRTVAVCLYANNIEPVSGEIRQHFPHVKRVHVADNDNKKLDKGNAGVTECALAVKAQGGWVFVPHVQKGTDVCDLYLEQGIDELKRQIYQSQSQYFNGKYSQHVVGKLNYIHDRYVAIAA
ncbi:toprim domain-containing protein [Alteromonas macleodii]|uniref:Toprim domain protein n=1 Tax=Alteromonas macleodii TaxID=28108 RepID=A0AB36FN35_ALTMA|nr:toprim domain-containing protein [Alteromonas macleodii]OES24241.1 toprim domain protein [Alteromonas macleodii]OES24872.1 toprim domain protein [Alteromonas macleodii]OES25150.1 toprim domain protein [Alteromonas macleodii]OES39191.1 toprim domain protein [Alteromonas macleodii]